MLHKALKILKSMGQSNLLGQDLSHFTRYNLIGKHFSF